MSGSINQFQAPVAVQTETTIKITGNENNNDHYIITHHIRFTLWQAMVAQCDYREICKSEFGGLNWPWRTVFVSFSYSSDNITCRCLDALWSTLTGRGLTSPSARRRLQTGDVFCQSPLKCLQVWTQRQTGTLNMWTVFVQRLNSCVGLPLWWFVGT